MTETDQRESLSVEESNELRAKLGLKPLHTQPSKPSQSPSTDVIYVEPIVKSRKQIDIEERLNEPLNRNTRGELIGGPTITELITDDVLDTKTWAKSERLKPKKSAAQKPVDYSEEVDDNTPEENIIDAHVVHDYKELDSGCILTLCDTCILEAQEDGLEDVDLLQSTELAEKERIEKINLRKKKKKQMQLSYEDYVSQAMEDSTSRPILSKYDDPLDQPGGSVSGFKNFTKGFALSSKGSRPGRGQHAHEDTKILVGNRRLNSDLDLTNKNDNEVAKSINNGYNTSPDCRKNTILKKAIPKLSKRTNVPSWDKLFSGTSAPPAPGYSVASPPDPPSPTPIPQSRRAVDFDLNSDEYDQMFYQQLTKQRRLKPSSTAGSSGIKQENVDNIKQESTSGNSNKNKINFDNIKREKIEPKIEITQASELCKSVGSAAIENSRVEHKTPSPAVEPSMGGLNPLEETPLDTGIANALKYLKSKGELQPVESAPNEVKLTYVNKYGRSMTPKEAFKELSYSFHGKLPGKNKQEKRLRKMEMELRKLRNPTDSLMNKALSYNQKSGNCPHLLLDRKQIN